MPVPPATAAPAASVEPDRVPSLLKLLPEPNPDVFSLDIDGVDYHVATRVLGAGCRPAVWVVEYNSAFGPELAVTVPYSPGFSRWSAHPSGLYYGCSVAGYRRLFAKHGYTFVGVERSGCNAFFVDPAAFPTEFVSALRPCPFLDNQGDQNGLARARTDAVGDLALPPRRYTEQLRAIDDLPLERIE